MDAGSGDPHVESLRYLLRPQETVKFDNAQPIEHETDAFHMRLESDIATFRMKEHHPSKQTARQCVEEWLRVWELDVGLRFGHQEIEFVFQDAEVIDRDPPQPGTIRYGSARLTASASVRATGTATRGEYPTPPTNLRCSADVNIMWQRYRNCEQGDEPLAGMAFYCLTRFGSGANRRERQKVADQYSVSILILDKLGDLSSEGGGHETARKFSKDSTGIDFTVEETSWIKAAVRALIRRKAEYDFNKEARLTNLTMADLPAI